MKTSQLFWKNFKNIVMYTHHAAGRRDTLGDFLPHTIQYSLNENEPRLTISHADTLVTLHFEPSPRGRFFYQLSIIHKNDFIVFMDYIIQPKLSSEVKHNLKEVNEFLSQFLASSRKQQVKKRYKSFMRSRKKVVS